MEDLIYDWVKDANRAITSEAYHQYDYDASGLAYNLLKQWGPT